MVSYFSLFFQQFFRSGMHGIKRMQCVEKSMTTVGSFFFVYSRRPPFCFCWWRTLTTWTKLKRRLNKPSQSLRDRMWMFQKMNVLVSTVEWLLETTLLVTSISDSNALLIAIHLNDTKQYAYGIVKTTTKYIVEWSNNCPWF